MFPVVLLIVLSSVVAAGALIWLIVGIRRDRRASAERLPAGADTALWSIVEAVPDPRNHIALTRDLTGEVRITGNLLDRPDLKQYDQAS